MSILIILFKKSVTAAKYAVAVPGDISVTR